MKFNLDENAKFVAVVAAIAAAAGAEVFSSGVDCQGFDEALIELNIGVIPSNGTLAIRIQESNDNGVADAYADVVTAANGFAATITVSTNTGLPGILFGRVDLAKRKRWLRAGYTVANQTIPFGLQAILSNEKYRPLASGQGEAGYPVASATAAGRCFQV